jgi:hypothetical protein
VTGHDDHDGRLRRPRPHVSGRACRGGSADGSGHRLFGIITASIAAYIVEQQADKQDQDVAA